MRVLCVNPRFPSTYWSFNHALRLIGKKATLPPLGLITVAALLPPHWEVRLCDMNVRALAPSDIDWAEVVFVSGMLVQSQSLHQVARLCRARGKTVVAGGPYATTSPDVVAQHVDCVVIGEAEALIAPLAAALERGPGHLPRRMQADERPDVRDLPPPRYDLLDIDAYQAFSVQWSRGCPFSCEFCDIIEVFGRRPRTKTPAQLCRELEAIRATGYRGSVFVVDDNFIGNKVEARRLLGPLAEWMRASGHPFDLYTEASLNLAADDALIDAMVAAGFNAVFVGIETPSEEALRETSKLQNIAVELDSAVDKLVARGLDVMAGFILGFDSDDAAALERVRMWIERSPIPLAMVGLLIALPGTQLERRLEREGRLDRRSDGDNLGFPNFQPNLDERTLLDGYARTLETLYSPASYFARALRSLALRKDDTNQFRLPLSRGLPILLRSLVEQGLRGSYRREYWRFLADALRIAPRRFTAAVTLAVQGEHMIRYTAEEVVPRVRRRRDHIVAGTATVAAPAKRRAPPHPIPLRA